MSGFIRGSLSDHDGQWDIAYVSLAGVATATLGSIGVFLTMSTLDWALCHQVIRDTIQIVDGKAFVTGAVVLTSCRYDPLPTGQAIGLASSAFAGALVALAAYMAATRAPAARPGIATTKTTTTESTQAAPMASAEPLKVDVLNLPDPKPSRAPKAKRGK